MKVAFTIVNIFTLITKLNKFYINLFEISTQVKIKCPQVWEDPETVIFWFFW